jgi:23S rRNA pseudouridine1911/1915/1917 synthase
MRIVVGAGGRADLALAAAIDGTSRKLLQRAFADGKVRLNGRRVRKGDPVAPGDVLEVDDVPDRTTLAPAPEPDLPLSVIWHDPHLVAVDKPPGMPSMPLVPGERGTLANALVARYPECLAAGTDPREAGLANRLDVGTSGLLLAARDREVWLRLRDAFRHGRVAKEYLALVEGAVDAPRTIDTPIAHDHSGAGGVRPVDDKSGLPATTEIRPERRLGNYSLVRCLAQSGRMHQVRAHLAWAGWPCVGDLRYGAAPTDLATEGPFLHAARLVLVHPMTGEQLTLEAPLPAARARVLAALAGH